MRLKPKKSLGQNFLVDKNIQRRIIAACSFYPDDIVLEIGPGRGELTRLIAPRVNRLCAVELDRNLACGLKRDFRDFPNVEIINRDILKFDLSAYHRKDKRRIKVIGNIPYYITTPIIGHLLKSRKNIEAIYLTVQNELSRRITAAGGSRDFGVLSCFVQYYAQPQILFVIKRGSFFPVPKVDSCLVRLMPKKAVALRPPEEKMFFKLVRSAFNQRRKMLRNSLRGIIPEEKLPKPLARPEELRLEDFMNLARL